jgi:magnesium chelatase family protein
VEVPHMRESELAESPAGEPSHVVRLRVVAACTRQADRQGVPNGRLEGGAIERHCAPDETALGLLRQAVSRLGLSARGYHRVLKVARTIADLAGSGAIGSHHLLEALAFRRADRTPPS